MKKLLFMTILSFGFLSANLNAISCYSTCTRHHCSGPKKNWDECFTGCWRKNEGRIPHCEAGAKEAGNIDDKQKAIMDQFPGN